jgi:hypothetical protein
MRARRRRGTGRLACGEMVDDVGVAGGGVAICTAGEEEGDDDEGVAEISAHAELRGADDDLYSHRVSTDLEPVAKSDTREHTHAEVE